MAHQVVLRDLQSLLRQSLQMDELTVEEVTTSQMVPLGENYGSTILKVHARVRIHQRAFAEQWHLIAKMLPPTDFQRLVFDCNYTVPKEIFLYEVIFPSYQKLEEEFGITPVFDVLPKFYGARLSLKEGAETVDDDAVILLENLKETGYYLAERKLGLDLEHATIAVRSLARFHVLGIAMKHHKPEFYEVIKSRSKCMEVHDGEFQTVIDNILSQIQSDPVLVRYEKQCRQALNCENIKQTVWNQPPEEPWSTLVHTDFWVNNFLFHKNSDKRVDDIKFVDFQNYQIMSPLRELAFFLGISLDIEVEKDNFYELIDLYYDQFVYRLKLMKCDTCTFTRAQFNKQLLKDGKMEFMHCTFMLKILTTEIDKNVDTSNIKNLMLMKGNGSYISRLRLLVKAYVERGWL